jgi:prolipoprotein diacylglyceryltransferase
MLDLMNIAIYLLIFAGGFLAHKFFFANRAHQGSKGWTNKEFDSTLTLAGLFILVGMMLNMFQDD